MDKQKIDTTNLDRVCNLYLDVIVQHDGKCHLCSICRIKKMFNNK